MWLARTQDPWVLDPFGLTVTEGTPTKWIADLERRFRRHRVDEALILAGADHGFWREERLCRRPAGWSIHVDSHRPVADYHRGRVQVHSKADVVGLERKTELEWHLLGDEAGPRVQRLGEQLTRWLAVDPDPLGIIRPPGADQLGLLVWHRLGDSSAGGQPSVFVPDRETATAFWSIWQPS